MDLSVVVKECKNYIGVFFESGDVFMYLFC